jgi:hypothetical protein
MRSFSFGVSGIASAVMPTPPLLSSPLPLALETALSATLFTGRSLAAIALSLVILTTAPTALAARRAAPLRLAGAADAAPGQIMTVAWPALADKDVDEMELVLSLDGGRTWPIRITGDLSPEATCTSFRVPSLPADEAVIALRAGREGERESEEILAESATFLIRVPALAVGENLRQIRGEWRTVEAANGQNADGPLLPGLIGPPSVSPLGTAGIDADDQDEEAPPAQQADVLVRQLSSGRPTSTTPLLASGRPPQPMRE